MSIRVEQAHEHVDYYVNAAQRTRLLRFAATSSLSEIKQRHQTVMVGKSANMAEAFIGTCY